MLMNKDEMAKKFRDFLRDFTYLQCDGDCEVCSFNDTISFEGAMGSTIRPSLCGILTDLQKKF